LTKYLSSSGSIKFAFSGLFFICSASKSSKLSLNSLYSFSHTTLSYSAVHGSNQLAFASSITVSTFLYAFSLTVANLSFTVFHSLDFINVVQSSFTILLVLSIFLILFTSLICHSLTAFHSGVTAILSPHGITVFQASSAHSINGR
jgi:hypothetical protein